MSRTIGRVVLTNGRSTEAQLTNADCVAANRCVCGFCTAQGQCELGDCRNEAVARCHGIGMCQACRDSKVHRIICGTVV
jgi:hypothetical protein